MSKRFINGSDFMEMVFSGAMLLQAKAADVNALNVFPVPDGDTGTNMNLTLTSGVEELKKRPSSHIGKAAEVLSKGLLMGARGNSGVILSQLFRGFAKSVQGLEQVNTIQLAAAFQSGVETAYQAVVKPVEGTILTVSKEAAKHAVMNARRTGDIVELMQEIMKQAKDALSKTPDLLPVLKQVGVVDSGGQGLVFIYEGFVSALAAPGEKPLSANANVTAYHGIEAEVDTSKPPVIQPLPVPAQSGSAQAKISTEDIEYLYDMEFFILFSSAIQTKAAFDEAYFRKQLEKDGDSILIIVDHDLVKVHVHSKKPGEVLNQALRYGEISRINIQNMRDQHRNLLDQEGYEAEGQPFLAPGSKPSGKVESSKPYGIIAVAAGDGISDIFSSLGVDYVLSGGQTMNPSTEDIVNAVRKVDAEKVFILPNNSNIILAAQQAKDLVDKEIAVIPTKTIPQGITAVLAFQEVADMERNIGQMNEAIQHVRSGQITFAVRDSNIDGLDIKENDYLGMLDNKIVTTNPDLLETSHKLLDSMIVNGDEIVTILTGADATEQQTKELLELVKKQYPDVEAEVHAGGQPIYYFIFSVE